MLKTKQKTNDPEAVRQNLINRALNLLSYRPQSITEMKIKLKRSGADRAMINQLLDNFIERGLLDDLKFSRWWVDQRLTFRPRGNIALKFELQRKGIDKDIIESVLLTREEERQLAKKLPRDKRKNKGFSFSVIDELKQKD